METISEIIAASFSQPLEWLFHFAEKTIPAIAKASVE
jgi:hypothetical protein